MINQEKEFFTCMRDKTFKYIVKTEAGKEVIKEIFKLITGITIEDMNFISEELKTSNKKVKGKKVDFLVKNKNIVLNVEMNNGEDSNILRNYVYINTLLINDFVESMKYTPNKNYYQINFSRKSTLNKIYEEYEVRSLKEGIVIIPILKIIEFDMEKIKNVCYNEENEGIDKLYKYIGVFNAEEKLLEKLSKGDELLEKFKEEVVKFNTEGRFWISPEEDEIMWENTIKELAMQRGLKEGEKKGEQTGILKTAKNMLKKGYRKSDIVEITGLTYSQINDLITK